MLKRKYYKRIKLLEGDINWKFDLFFNKQLKKIIKTDLNKCTWGIFDTIHFHIPYYKLEDEFEWCKTEEELEKEEEKRKYKLIWMMDSMNRKLHFFRIHDEIIENNQMDDFYSEHLESIVKISYDSCPWKQIQNIYYLRNFESNDRK